MKKITQKIVHTQVSNQEPLDLKSLDEPLGCYTLLTIFLILRGAGTVVTRKNTNKYEAQGGGWRKLISLMSILTDYI